eukprot:TRINITY_DN32414_c0_g1_i1.p1 TRINITY_DN32414_c0_g1~~TRINITY_DN32414_c0_g1_i1.p1  ORF type:complete len:986 (+),score=223.21 TRINITY_DN32414_c0_g1_i1:52-2958(+)
MEEAKREEIIRDIFTVLDQKQRGFVSKVELAHILDAMQADSKGRLDIPEALVPAKIQRDSKIHLQDLGGFLAGLSINDLEDARWFASSVVKVEAELQSVWQEAVQQWQEHLAFLYERDLHRYLLDSQPARVSRWLLLRTSIDGSGNGFVPGVGSLGISSQEVETLFADETSEYVLQCTEKMKPLLLAAELRQQLEQLCLQDTSSDGEEPVLEVLAQLRQLVEGGRELACLLTHEDTVGFASALVCSRAFSQAVTLEASKLIVAILNHRIHENARDYERLCRDATTSFLEIDLNLLEGSLHLQEILQLSTSSELAAGRAMLHERKPHSETIAHWVGSLLTLQSDLDRGEMIDALIKFDEQRFATKAEGGLRDDESAPVPSSVFAHGRIVPLLLGRLDLASHHSLHEHRTPMRTHLWKLLLNVISSAGPLGRELFRAGEGMRVICNVLRGSSWGVERPELTAQEEEDLEEEQELLNPSGYTSWASASLSGSWPNTDYVDEVPRYYAMDFIDDKFYGSKDQVLAVSFLEYMASPDLWGESGLVEEMLQYPNTLQVLCRVHSICAEPLKLLLSSEAFPAYLHRTAQLLARHCTDKAFRTLIRFNVARPSLSVQEPRHSLEEAEVKKHVLRLLAYAYHCLQTAPEGGEAAPEAVPGVPREELCGLLAAHLPLSQNELMDIAANAFIEFKDFARKAVLAANPLPYGAGSEQVARLGTLVDEASLACLRSAAETFSSASRHSPSASTTSNEFLVMLRVVQLMQCTHQQPGFVSVLQAHLEKLMGWPGQMPEAPPAGPVRVGFWEVPLRRSHLRRFSLHSPMAVIDGLSILLKDFAEASEDDGSRQSLVALALNHLCYFAPEEVTLEASSEGLSKRLGVDASLLASLKLLLEETPLNAVKLDVADLTDFAADSEMLPNCCSIFQHSYANLGMLFVSVTDSQAVAFVCMAGVWKLWASNLTASTLADCTGAQAHFGF